MIDLSAQLTRADGKATARYLPLSAVMGARTREWVASGVLAGQASDVRLRLKGDLHDFRSSIRRRASSRSLRRWRTRCSTTPQAGRASRRSTAASRSSATRSRSPA
ncbi:MAG: DUF3971 domain-containing protein [Verrucomicrobiota bacterium]